MGLERFRILAMHGAEGRHTKVPVVMTGALTNFAVAVAITAAICYVLMTRAENRRRRRRIDAAGGDSGGAYLGSDDGFTISDWFSRGHSTSQSALDSSDNHIDGGGRADTCSSDTGGDGGGGGWGGDCGGGGGDGGGGD